MYRQLHLINLNLSRNIHDMVYHSLSTLDCTILKLMKYGGIDFL